MAVGEYTATAKPSVARELLVHRRGTTEESARQERRVRGEEVGCGCAEPILLSGIRDRLCPLFGQGWVKLSGAAVYEARPLSSYEQPPSRLISSMSSVQHPGDSQMLNVIHSGAVMKHRSRLPRVGQFVVSHRPSCGASISPYRLKFAHARSLTSSNDRSGAPRSRRYRFWAASI